MGEVSSISIVTACLNRGKDIERTIASIGSQKLPPFEYIIIDGGSTDGTIEIIKKNEAAITYWKSEPDGGIAAAMNKGLTIARGEYVLFLHADDYLPKPETLLEIEEVLACRDVYIFDYYFETSVGKERRTFHDSDFWFNFKGVCHQATVCRRDLFSRFGAFDENLSICMDYDFFLRLRRHNIVFQNNPERVLSVMGGGGVSSQSDWVSVARRLQEEKTVHFKNCPNIFYKGLYTLWWAIYPTLKKTKK